MSRDSVLAQPLAHLLEIEALVTREAELDAEFPLRDLPRIAASLLREDGTAQVHLRFHREQIGEHRYPAAEGRVTTTLALVCQRCLEAVDVAVDAHCQLVFVASEEAAAGLPASHDPVTMSNGRVSLPDLVEEELLLALPLIPAHPDETCKEREEPQAEDSQAAPTQRPFAGLRELMKSVNN